MNYDYRCDSCEESWEESRSMNDRDAPMGEKCPKCGESDCVKRIPSVVRMSYQGRPGEAMRKAGSGWNDVLGKIKKGAGRKSTINTK